MPVLLKVVSNIKKVNFAPVTTSMDLVKARELSIVNSLDKANWLKIFNLDIEHKIIWTYIC